MARTQWVLVFLLFCCHRGKYCTVYDTPAVTIRFGGTIILVKLNDPHCEYLKSGQASDEVSVDRRIINLSATEETSLTIRPQSTGDGLRFIVCSFLMRQTINLTFLQKSAILKTDNKLKNGGPHETVYNNIIIDAHAAAHPTRSTRLHDYEQTPRH